MITYGSGLRDGNAHDHADLPLVLAGRACGKIKPGRHVIHPRETPMANLFVAMLDRMSVPVESLGDSKGTLGICPICSQRLLFALLVFSWRPLREIRRIRDHFPVPLILACALAAGPIPARRAAKLDPAQVLRTN